MWKTPVKILKWFLLSMLITMKIRVMNHIIGTCPKISDEDHKRFIAIIKKDQQKARSYLILERPVSVRLSGALVLKLHLTSSRYLISTTQDTLHVYICTFWKVHTPVFSYVKQSLWKMRWKISCEAVSMKDQKKHKHTLIFVTRELLLICSQIWEHAYVKYRPCC
jgi:hypothetical protein